MGEMVNAEIAVIGAGSVGIAVAYYLVRDHGFRNVVLIDSGDPMSLTSAQSGENYRNWWPHPVMTAFTNDGIALLETIAADSGNRINMTRRGYALVTRRDSPAALIDDLYRGYGRENQGLIRVHEAGTAHANYLSSDSSSWENKPDGVDVLLDRALIRQTFPSYADDVSAVLHIRRAGSISSQQLGMYMLEAIRAAGGCVIRGAVKSIEQASSFSLSVQTAEGQLMLQAGRIVNAAGPMLNDIAAMLGEQLPVSCVYQQKIAFEDREGAIARTMPFTIDLDEQQLFWTDEEREILAQSPETEYLLKTMGGGSHCRPDGTESGKWIKMGWAYNKQAGDPHADAPLDTQFPDSVLRACSRLHPGLRAYIGRIPRNMHHYGGYYTMTRENWPLIGQMQTKNAFVAGALAGFGTMAATITGSLCAAWVADAARPAYADALSPARYQNRQLMEELTRLNATGAL